MASVPIVDTVDKRIGIISAVVLMIIAFVVLWFLTYDIPNPLPKVRKVPAVAMVDEIVLKELVVESGGGGGQPNKADDPTPKPQTQQSITQNNKPRPTSTNTGGQANTSNTQNSQEPTSGGKPDNPFGPGGSGGGNGGGDGPGFGPDKGEGTGPGDGIGFGKGRTRLNNVDVHNLSIETDASIYYKLTVDSKGNVVAFSHLAAKTTTTNSILINRIGLAIQKQVKYNEAPGAPLEYQFYTIHVKAT